MYEIVTIPPKEGKKIQCQCGYEWIYSGSSVRYATCSKCRSVVTLQPKRKNQQKSSYEIKDKDIKKRPSQSHREGGSTLRGCDSSNQTTPRCDKGDGM
ncbi:MAG: hypothetical protein M3044_00750 [Thermoproteota archaeon]|nr:hypothetical protein [Thermoproteota archaeon]